MKRNKVTRQKTEHTYPNVMMPRPDVLLKYAERAPGIIPHACVADYCDSILVLRKKHYGWGKIQQWLAKRGVKYSIPSINSAYKRWTQANGIVRP